LACSSATNSLTIDSMADVCLVALMRSREVRRAVTLNGNRSSPDAIKFLDARGANFRRKV
jgi:hypothetical protein